MKTRKDRPRYAIGAFVIAEGEDSVFRGRVIMCGRKFPRNSSRFFMDRRPLGKWRCVVQDEDGVCHIFSEERLEFWSPDEPTVEVSA